MGAVSTDIRHPSTDTPKRLALAVLLTGQTMASVDASIVSVAAQTIREDLGADAAEIQLVVSGYLLTTGVLFVTCARLGDLIGHRRAFLVGLGWFTVASLLCGVSPGPEMLVVARISQAVGAALLMPQVFSLVHRQWEGTQRHRAIGVYSMVLALGVALGQVVGGLVVSADVLGLSWRPIFLVNLPIGLVAVIVGLRHLPAAEVDRQGRLQPVAVALLTVAMTAITLPLILGPEHGWSVGVWAVLVCGVVLLGAFVRHETSTREPLLDLAALRPTEVRLGMVSCCVVMGCYTAFLLTLTVYLQSERGLTPLEAGLAFVPYAAGFGTLSLTWTSYSHVLQRVLPIVGPLGYAAGVVLVVLVARDRWDPVICTALLLAAGAGHAAAYSPLIAVITSKVEPRLASAISALNSTGPVLAEVVAVAGLGTVYFSAPDPATGLLRVAVATAVLLIGAAGCAARAVLVHERRPGTDAL